MVLLLLLLSINLMNYIDRQVLAAVEPEIRETFFPGESKSARAMAATGSLATAFLLCYMLGAPVFALLAERCSRWLLIAAGVAVWSLASGASGLAQVFALLWLTRCFVGIGEAAYGPVAPAVISDLFPVAKRGQVLSWFYTAIPVGGAIGYGLGGYMKGLAPAAESWRWAFYLVVLPGLALAIWAFLMRDPPRGASDLAAPARKARWKDYLILLRTRSYVLNTLGMTAMTFAIGALAWWMPDYLKVKGVEDVFGRIEPVTFFGVVTAVAGLLATLAGGWAGDALRSRMPGSYFLVSGVGLLISAPCCLVFLALPFPAAWVFIFLTVFFLFFNTGPTNTILANVTHPSMRATAFGLNILVIHALGDAISPPLIGAIAGWWSHAAGFAVVSVFMIVGGLFWLWGARYLEGDTQRAPHLLD
jgi:predicted MFS family arabinose efflux permease